MTASPFVGTEPLLSVEGLNFSYGQLQVLFGVDLHVDQREAVALLGTNGAGKSTLLRAICGLATPSAGRVRFDGRQVTGTQAERLVREGIVLVEGGNAVFRDMTVAENLELQAYTASGVGAKETKRRRAEVFEAFPRVADRLHQKAGLLSGGEQQQLALAKALLLAPKLLCIDELSLGLAPVVVQDLLVIVRGIQERGCSILLVEQSLNIAASLCPRAVFMEKGEVRFEGATRDLLERDDIARAVFFGAAQGDTEPSSKPRAARGKRIAPARQPGSQRSTPKTAKVAEK